MVDVIGHFGMALVWLAPTWVVVDRPKTAATAVATGFWFGMLPDIDLVLSNVDGPGVHHHGVFHTVLAALVFAAIVGPALGWGWKRALGDSEWFPRKASDRAYRFGFVVVLVAVLSHVFADMLSAPDIAQAVEPFWPVYQQSIGIDVVRYNDPWVNWGLFLGGLVLNGALWYWATNRWNERNAATT